MLWKQSLLVIAVLCATSLLVREMNALAVLSLGSPVPEPSAPLCDQEELMAVVDLIITLRIKKQCEREIDEMEMMKAVDPSVVCDYPICIDALQFLYGALPQCRFRDWNVHFHAEMLLRNCGVKPRAKMVQETGDVIQNSLEGTIDAHGPKCLSSSSVPPVTNQKKTPSALRS